MRNLKIGAKLILGFGVVLLMMVVIVVTVIISNTTTLDNVDNIDLGSELQVKTNTLTARFNDARISANTLYDIISDDAYESFCDYIDECEVILSDIYDHISQHPILERFRPQFQSFEGSMLKWRAEIDNVQRDNDAIAIIDTEFTTVGAALNAVNSKALSDQLALLRAEAAGELSEDALTDRAYRIEFAQSIQSEIFAIRMKSRVMMDLFDISEYESLIAMVDDTLKNTNDYKNLARQQANKDTAQEIIDSLELYRECIMKFVTKIDESESTMGAAKPIGLSAVDSLSDIVTDIDDAMDSRVKSTISSVTLSLILVISISVLSIIVSVVLALVITSGITKPLNHMRDFLVQIGTTGNLVMDSQAQENAAQESKSKDEVGQCSVAMLAFLNHLANVGKTLDSVADGDLTVDVKLLSEKDSMGLAVEKMVKNLGEMFCEINESSNMVSAGAKQMADGAQSLAQGSTEQAAAVEQLSSSISQVAEQTRDNADMSSRAASLADTIRQSAEKESHQMGQMLKAVKEIGEASQNIGKVIKAINDIAFQTNILALNAAVEAARAGQHGKGFAVVAEEVRSLAAKSADAAKNTESLIANSIEKAELGAHIAEETSASLAEIVSEISDSSRIIGDIAKSSSEQTASINQINEGINQVAQVVQQNSATAEESAAASEEISGQSAMLQELISRFKLNDTGARHIDYYTESSPKASMPLMPRHPYKPDIIMPEKY